MAPEISIFWRALISMILLGLYVKITKLDLRIKSLQDFNAVFLGGGLMGIHWVTYFYSLLYSNVAVALLTLHTFPAMTSILEPLILKTRFKIYQLFLAMLVMLGIYLISPEFKLDDDTTLAVIFGLISALAYALRNIYTRKVVSGYNGSVMMFFQLAVTSFVLLPMLFFKDSTAFVHDIPYLMGLVVISTSMGHTLLVHYLKKFSAVTVGLMSAIIPVYGILWAFIFLGEVPAYMTIIGGLLILASFVAETVLSNKFGDK